jgi:hypothetical protein
MRASSHRGPDKSCPTHRESFFVTRTDFVRGTLVVWPAFLQSHTTQPLTHTRHGQPQSSPPHRQPHPRP